MKQVPKAILISIIVLAVVIGTMASIIYVVQTRSNARFSELLARFKVGQPYADVENILGKPTRSLTEPNDVKEWGQDSEGPNCINLENECNLHMFGRMDFIPHRYILIYENKKTHAVQCVTWKYT